MICFDVKYSAGTRGYAGINCLVAAGWYPIKGNSLDQAHAEIARNVRSKGVELRLCNVSAPTVSHESRTRMMVVDGKRRKCRFVWASIEIGRVGVAQLIDNPPADVKLESTYTPTGHSLTRRFHGV